MEDGDKVYSTCEEVFNDEQPDYDIGDYYYSGTVKKLKPSDIMYDGIVDTLLEHMGESLYEEVGEVACDNLDMSQAKQVELLGIIKAFVDENVSIACFKVIDIEEHRMGEEDE